MDLDKYMIPCLSKTLFGMECLGCGFQRGLLFLLKGDFTAAFQMYPAVYTTLLFLIILGLHFIDKQRNYKNLMISMAIINGLFMIVGYLYKHYY
ncbi:hypothetical protein H4V97_002948 [Flavobacterium sp. CG_23.5]|uniref:DUF2752 domain-containing protein n=1 Tax=Flavobacterium sp. CG_23.5 TaxID=2760708 RepID=UPI001EC90DEA|nr:DUF2752 domain-containing protein [Flavobacterium sp. CG_23.5]MBP2284630.1 hypothetical protein [Flavobacterium sp. CG_23.5]